MQHKVISEGGVPHAAADLRLSRNAVDYHRIAHDPAVLPFTVQKGQGGPDLTAFFEDPRNMGFFYRDCAFLAHFVEPGIYEVHSMALPVSRGRYVVEAASTAIRYMFFATDAMELQTRVVAGNIGAEALSAKVGFQHEFDRANAWQAVDGPRAVHFYAMRYPEWVKSQDWLRVSGEWFHSLLDEVDHEDDPAHDLYVGAAVETLLGGQPEKAVALYNRWARFAGYLPISISSMNPLTVNIQSHLVTLDGGKIEVARCQ